MDASEEFVTKAKNNLVRLVKSRLEQMHSISIQMGEVIIDDDNEEQWITISGGDKKQRKTAKNYLITLCNSEDEFLMPYEKSAYEHFLRHQNRIEQETGACLVFTNPGTINLYGDSIAVTLAETALDHLKKEIRNGLLIPGLPEPPRINPGYIPVAKVNISETRVNKPLLPENISEAKLNELLIVKCREHDLLFDDYKYSSMSVKTTLLRWLMEDMDKSTSSLIDDDNDNIPTINECTIDCDETDCDINTTVMRNPRKAIDHREVNDDIEQQKRFILRQGYTRTEYESVKVDLPRETDISEILAKLVENRLRDEASTNDKGRETRNASAKGKETKIASAKGKETKIASAKRKETKTASGKGKETKTTSGDTQATVLLEAMDTNPTAAISITSNSNLDINSVLVDEEQANLMIYFEDFLTEEEDLNREEYLEKNLKRQQLLMAHFEKRKAVASAASSKALNSNDSVAGTTTNLSSGARSSKQNTADSASKGKKLTKRQRRKEQKVTKNNNTSISKSNTRQDQESSDDFGDSDKDNVTIMESEVTINNEDYVTIDVATPSRVDDAAAFVTIDVASPSRLGDDTTLINKFELTHSPLAENNAAKKKQKFDHLSNNSLPVFSSPFRGVLGDASAQFHSTPLAEPRLNIASRFRASAAEGSAGGSLQDEPWQRVGARQQRHQAVQPIASTTGDVRHSSRMLEPVHGRNNPYGVLPTIPDTNNAALGSPIASGGGRSTSRHRRGKSRSPETESIRRPIVIDGSNVACAHGIHKTFSSKGIKYAVDYFMKKGYNNVTVFVPNWRKGGANVRMPTVDREILLQLEEDGILSFTPSRYLNGKNYVCYDDRFIIQLASDNDGVVVSNDNYRDLMSENPQWRKVIETRLLMYTFAGDRFMVPDDPFGPQGPRLEQLLTRGFEWLPRNTEPYQRDPASGVNLPTSSGHVMPKKGQRNPPGRAIRNAPCRPHQQTEELFLQLCNIFPESSPVIRRVLDNHINETDVNRLTSHILDVLR